MLTPKETGGGAASGVYPVDIEYSALLESGYSSTGAPGTNATMALSFKPSIVNTGYPLCDPGNHYMLLIVKTGTSVEVFNNNRSLGTYTTSAATFAGLLSEALTAYCGAYAGYYSNLHVADGSALSWSDFFELSGRMTSLWVWKRSVSATCGAYGGHYTFDDSNDLGADSSGNGNDWTMSSGTQSDDTPTHNGGAATWEALEEPVLDPAEYFFQCSFVAEDGVNKVIEVPWHIEDEKWILQLSTPDGEYFKWFDSERNGNLKWEMSRATDSLAGGFIYTGIDGDCTLRIGNNIITGGYAYIVTIWRCNDDSPFDVQLVSHTTGTETLFTHACGDVPNSILVHGCSGTAGGPYWYNESLGVDKYMPEWSNSPYAAISGMWDSVNSTQAGLWSSLATGTYVVYLFAPPLSVTASYVGNGSTDGPVIALDGRASFLWLDLVTGYGQGFQTDTLRNPANPCTGFQYLNGYTASHTGLWNLRTNGVKMVMANINTNGVTGIAWGCIDQNYKYSNPL